jgi:hypothetical protein
MSIFKLTESSDLDRGPNNKGFSRIGGADETATHVRTRLRLFRGDGYGEVKRDITIGVNFFDFVVDPRTPEGLIAAHLQQIILDTPGIVESFLRFDLLPEEQEMVVTFDAIYESENQRIRREIHQTLTVALGDN